MPAAVDLMLHGANKPILVICEQGRRWVKKRLSPPGRIAAEAIGALLGRELGVLTPDFAYFDEPSDGKGWLSSFISDCGKWQSHRLNILENSSTLGNILCLDALIYNEDRNIDNFLFEVLPSGAQVRVWSIDTEVALVSRPREFAAKSLAVPSPHALPKDLQVSEELRIGALDAAKKAEALPEARIRGICAAATAAAGILDAEILELALSNRCRHAVEIVENYLSQAAAELAHP